MTLAARDVAAVLRRKLPGLPTKKLHTLLYYCQGHHLATFGEPLFAETISAWDMGPVVGTLWYAEANGAPATELPTPPTEAQLNTIGYVVSRYGALTGRDLEHLTHSEEPWRRADQLRRPAGSARIEPEWIREYFSATAADEEDETPLDASDLAHWLEGARERREEPARPDSLDEIRARLTRA